MRALISTRTRLQSAINLATELAQGDFPNEHARLALFELRSIFTDGLNALAAVNPESDPAVVKTLCAAESAKLFSLFPYLGFLSRSTEIRNAFEVHGPLLRLVVKLLDPQTHLVISSEWEYSPFTFVPPRQAALSGTVMIGAPASESWNALTLPLAGHELGHNVWARKDLGSKVGPIVLESILSHVEGPGWSDYQRAFPDFHDRAAVRTDLILRSTLAQCYEWAIRQCEEVFCDCLGLLLFREAFLHAFEYLLAPGLPYPRSFHYPPSKQRALLLERAAKLSEVSISADYAAEFEDEPGPSDERIKVLLAIADVATAGIMEQLLAIGKSLIEQAGIQVGSQQEQAKIVRCFSLCVPPQGTTNLASIVRGAWAYYLSGMKEWHDQYPEVFTENRSLEMLSDLAFKAIEINEIEEKQR